MLTFDEKNPYQACLAAGLSPLGCKVFPAKDFTLFPLVANFLRVGRFDLVHLHWLESLLLSKSRFKSLLRFIAFYFEVKLLRLLGVRFVFTVHNLQEHEQRHPELFLWYCRRLVPLFDALIVHSQYAKTKVVESYSRKKEALVEVIPHGNYCGVYPDDISREAARRELGLAATDRVFLFFGAIRDYKGVPELISSFRSMSRTNVKLLIAGRVRGKEAQARLQAQLVNCKDILAFLNQVPDEQIQVFFRAADVVVLPFRHIFTSGSVLLAMSFGKAVVVPQLDSLAEIISKDGFCVYSAEDPQGLRHALNEVLERPLDEMGRANYVRAKQFDWEHISAKTMELFLTVKEN